MRSIRRSDELHPQTLQLVGSSFRRAAVIDGPVSALAFQVNRFLGRFAAIKLRFGPATRASAGQSKVAGGIDEHNSITKLIPTSLQKHWRIQNYSRRRLST